MQTSNDDIPEITPTELKARLDRKDSLVLVDVREPHEPAIADLPESGQVLIPLRELPDRAGELDPASEVVLYLQIGCSQRQGLATASGTRF